MARSPLDIAAPHTGVHRARRFLEPPQERLVLGIGLALFGLMARTLARRPIHRSSGAPPESPAIPSCPGRERAVRAPAALTRPTTWRHGRRCRSTGKRGRQRRRSWTRTG